MLTSLRFKNWRSLAEQTINFTPITVLIGANSAGKSNIIDALYFLRESVTTDPENAMRVRGWEDSVRTLEKLAEDDIELEIGYRLNSSEDEIFYKITNKQIYDRRLDGDVHWYSETLADQSKHIILQTNDYFDSENQKYTVAGRVAKVFAPGKSEATEVPFSGHLVLPALGRLGSYPESQSVYQFISQRWQLLDEFANASLAQANSDAGEVYLVDRCADNVPTILDFMYKRHPQVFSEMQETLRYLVRHVANLETTADERETRLGVQEKFNHVEDAPTVSAGTKRLIGILTAYYALEMRSPEVPGLIVLEEPDMAVHPLLLRRLVEQLRVFTEQEGKPRQFIITTHNPALLNLFEPKEVRIVERNEAGETSVRQADEVLIEKWREQTGDYNLGDLWTTRLLGGVPQ